MEAVVFRQLYAGDKTENAVFENQHQHRRESAEAGKQRAWRFVDQQGDAYDYGDNPYDAFYQLYEAVEGQTLLVLA